MRWMLALLALLALSGCPSPPLHVRHDLIRVKGQPVRWRRYDYPLHILVPAETSPWLKDAVRRSAAVWDEKVGRHVFQVQELPRDHQSFFGAAPMGSVTLEFFPFNGEVFLHHRLVQGFTWFEMYSTLNGTHGYVRYKPTVAHITVDSQLPNYVLDRVLMHELGHALGLGHDSTSSSVMHAYSKPESRHFFSDDVEYVRSTMQ